MLSAPYARADLPTLGASHKILNVVTAFERGTKHASARDLSLNTALATSLQNKIGDLIARKVFGPRVPEDAPLTPAHLSLVIEDRDFTELPRRGNPSDADEIMLVVNARASLRFADQLEAEPVDLTVLAVRNSAATTFDRVILARFGRGDIEGPGIRLTFAERLLGLISADNAACVSNLAPGSIDPIE